MQEEFNGNYDTDSYQPEYFDVNNAADCIEPVTLKRLLLFFAMAAGGLIVSDIFFRIFYACIEEHIYEFFNFDPFNTVENIGNRLIWCSIRAVFFFVFTAIAFLPSFCFPAKEQNKLWSLLCPVILTVFHFFWGFFNIFRILYEISENAGLPYQLNYSAGFCAYFILSMCVFCLSIILTKQAFKRLDQVIIFGAAYLGSFLPFVVDIFGIHFSREVYMIVPTLLSIIGILIGGGLATLFLYQKSQKEMQAASLQDYQG